MSQQPIISLLWTDGHPDLTRRTDSTLIQDLSLKRLVRSLSLHPDYESHVRAILLTLTTDPQTIRYRQAVLADLLHNPDLVQQLRRVLDEIITLQGYLTTPQWSGNVLRQVAWRLSELDRYVETVKTLHRVLTDADAITSAGFTQLRDHLGEIITSDFFVQLQQELPQLLAQIRNIRSITVGINLDPEMRPVAATLLSANPKPFAGESMLSRLFNFGDADDKQALHDARKIDGIAEDQIELRDHNSPFMPQLFKDLSDLLDETSQPIANALRKYTQINSNVLIALKLDIAFYLGAVQMIETVQATGLPMCQPDVLDVDARTAELEGVYNINLCLQQLAQTQSIGDIVGNHATFDEDGRIFILTGPNQGGKTTYTQAVGVAQMLFQAGLHVPAQSARMSPVDAIYTHFAAEERPDLESGRLGEEARRLHDIFQHATRHSLILLNESLASTAASESLILAQEIVKAFRLLGARAIFATHLLELAAQVDNLNTETRGDSCIISMVSQVDIETDSTGQQIKRTYKIVPSPPMQKSYAIELAARYGISYEQITDLLRERDVI